MNEILGSERKEKLISEIERIGLEQDAIIYETYIEKQADKYNSLYVECSNMIQELFNLDKKNAVESLSKHLRHINVQVRLNAACALYRITPIEARAIFEDIARNRHLPQMSEAKDMLIVMDNDNNAE